MSGKPEKERRLMLIDGHSLLHRAFFALPTMTTSAGAHTNAVYGFATMLMRVLEDEQPDMVAVAFDKEAPTFRHMEYAGYKAQRPKMADELRSQVPLVKELVQAFRLPICELEGYEADDVLGTLARRAEQQGLSTIIVTGDKDALQLVGARIMVLITRKGMTEMDRYDAALVQERLGVAPAQVVDYKALVGDTSDNIPGVSGIGAKTAAKLLAEYGSVTNLLDRAGDIPGKVGQLLRTHVEDARLSLRLATIDTDVPLPVDFTTFQRQEPDGRRLVDLCTRLEMRFILGQLAKRFAISGSQLPFYESAPEAGVAPSAEDRHADGERSRTEQPELQLEQADRAGWPEKVAGLADPLTLFAGFTSGDAMRAAPWLLSAADQGRLIYTETDDYTDYARLLASGRPFCTHDLKMQLVVASRRGGPPPVEDNWPNADDLLLIAYLLNPAQGDHSLADVAIKEGIGVLPPLAGDEADKPAGLVGRHQALRAGLTNLRPRLAADGLESLYRDVEMPLSLVLARMELAGIAVDRTRLASMSAEMNTDITRLTEEIYELAGLEFNLNSPKQLADVLFGKLGLPVSKSTKTGPSTAADVLEELAQEHAVPQLILDYRQLAKLKGTYVDALPLLIHPETGRVHTTFNQAVTATGRLSSTNPNLQNIPVRTALGKQIRSAFVPGKPGWVLLAADYSQIELRVLAHLSGDANLLAAFHSGADIHAKTAAEVFGVDPTAVSPAMRSAAKAINFGIVYGISSFGLARGTGLSRKAAQAYIDSYFHRYAGVKEYMEKTVAEARTAGYVTTLLGRRRYLPDLHSRKWPERSFAERTAMNTPIQGSAADIIKLAMLQVDKRLRQAGLETRLLLQVHDELVLEGPQEELADAAAIIKEAMEKACALSVPLAVDVGAGPNWLDTEELTHA